MKILTIIGARPQFIKASAISRVICERRARGDNLSEVLVHTGQHFDENMSQVFFDELDIPLPDYNLEISHSTSHGEMTGRMLEKIDEVIRQENPDWVFVYGDTNSTIAGALAAVKLNVAVAHIEAGLRSFNRRMPEEINRVLTDHASDMLFAPTITAEANLLKEGISQERIKLSGDVMFDSALYYGSKSEEQSDIVERLGLKFDKFVLATIHRAENTDDKSLLENIRNALFHISSSIPVVWPLHPRTKKSLELLDVVNKGYPDLHIINPVGYLDMVALEKNAALVITDSGGVQKEAYFHGKPCVTLREETEWVELVDSGWNVLVSPESDEIEKNVLNAIGTRGEKQEFYGDGNSSSRIIDHIFQ